MSRVCKNCAASIEIWIYCFSISILSASFPALAERPDALSPQTISLPSGPASLKGLGESFSPNMSTGTGNFSVPIQVVPSPLAPSVTLTYTGGKGKGPLGMSFRLPVLNIYRTTDKGLPEFNEKDRFAVEGPSLNDELVLVNRDRGYYRLKNEGPFALFERDSVDNSWTIHLANGQKMYLGEREQSRQTANGLSYRWFVERHVDQFGREIKYEYLRDQQSLYLQVIRYKTHKNDWSYTNRVEFDYGSRSDEYTDYTYGAPVTTSLRLNTIKVFHDKRCLRTYTLEYGKEKIFTLLTQVKMTGEFGEPMPTLRFGYLAHSQQSGHFVKMVRLPKLEGLFDGRAQLEDVNGDALPDILYGERNNYYYYENIDGRLWDNTATVIDNPPDRNLYDDGVVLADMNGDGFRDVVHRHVDDGETVFRYYPGGRIRRGFLERYLPFETVTTDEPLDATFTGTNVRITDLNHDGRVDLLYQTASAESDKQLVNINNHLRALEIDELPADVDLSRSEVLNIDFNGDGIMDFVRARMNLDEPRVRVWYGLGHGQYALETTMGNVPIGLANEIHFQDVNQDGQTDIVRVSGSWVAYYLNNGNGSYTDKMGSFYGMPPISETKKLLFADMNGNGTTDVVWLTKDFQFKYLDLMGEANAGLLTRIDNGMGLVTNIRYKSSTEYMAEAKKKNIRWNTTLPISVPVISEITTTDSLDRLGLKATTTRITYEYYDGYYEGREREFRGFAKVIAASVGDDHHPTKVIETRMHVGTNLKTLEDEEILKGKPWMALIKDEGGTLFTSTETKWEQRWLCQEDLTDVELKILPECGRYLDKYKYKDNLVAYATQTESLNGSWEGTTTPIFTATSNLEWDSGWASVTKNAQYGIVAFAGGHQPGEPFSLSKAVLDIGNDEVITRNRRIYDVDNWLIGLTYLDQVMDGQENVVAQNRIFFDGKPFVGLELGKVALGLVTRQQGWLSSEDRWISTNMMSYNEDGLVDQTLNAKGHRREIEYDLKTRSLPTVERFYLDEGSILEYSAQYDTGLGALTSATDFNGNTSHFCYDGLGRTFRMYAPDSLMGLPPDTDHDEICLLEQPNAEYKYEFGNPISTTKVTALVNRESGSTSTSWQYTDGLGRVRQTKSEAESLHKYIATGWQVLSSQGSIIFSFDSFSTDVLGIEAAPSYVPFTENFFDSLGRETKVHSPAVEHVRTYTLTQYLPNETRVYDERDTTEKIWNYPAVTRTDGLGRITEIVKYNDVNGTFTPLQWTVGYDTLGNITSFSNPIAAIAVEHGELDLAEKHTRRYQYDSLGRMVFLSDANVNEVWYDYDDLGNLVQRRDSKNQIQQWVYGDVNRLMEKHAWVKDNPEAKFSTYYHYDKVDPNGPFAGKPQAETNLKGQFAWVKWPTGTHHVIYDMRNRLTNEAQTVWNPDTSTFEDQEQDLFEQSYEYNTAGELIAQSAPGGLDLSFTYNQRSLLTRVEGGFAGSIQTIFENIKYDHRGLPLTTEQGNKTATCAWHDDRRQLISYQVGPSLTTHCDNAQKPNNQAFIQLNYNRTPTGLLSNMVDLSPERADVPRLDASYEYDRLYQLTQANIRPNEDSKSHYTINYAYDVIQNLTKREVSGGSVDLITGEFKYGERGNGPNQITSAGGKTFDYDQAGQMKYYNGYDLTFDSQGRLAKAKKVENGRIIEYHYNDLGEKKITIVKNAQNEIEKVFRYIFGNFQIRDGDPTWIVSGGLGQLEITKSQGIKPDLNLIALLEKYVDDFTQTTKPVPEEYLDLDQDGDRLLDQQDINAARLAMMYDERVGGENYIWRYVHKDHLGGTTHTSDSVGDLISHQKFQPYGKKARRIGLKSTFGFAGAEIEDETDLGLMKFGARWYAPNLGRWVSADLLFLEDSSRDLEFALQSSLYSYSGNDPINNRDSSGNILDTILDVGFILYDTGSLVYNLATGNKEAAKIDALALAADVACAVAPLATGGGAAVRAAKEGAKRLATKEGAKQLAKQAAKELVHGVPQATKEGGEILLHAGTKKTAQGQVKAQQAQAKAKTKQGGSYIETVEKGKHSHHMPADSISPIDRNKGPAIKMDPADHRKTASWGSSKEAKKYRNSQKDLIEQGKFDEAQRMDIEDVQSKFGNKYDNAIDEMLEYTQQQGFSDASKFLSD